MVKQGAEKRKFARLDIALTVTYRVASTGGITSEFTEATSGDISAGGIRLMTPSPLDNGAMLDLEIYIEGDDDPIHVSGEVAWQTKISETSFETGVSLAHMENKDKSKFLNFIFEQMSKLVGFDRGGTDQAN